MHIRKAVPDDNAELQKLQAQCPVGTSLIVSTVNTPDFFARTKAYEFCKVYVACRDSQIVGSAAFTTREVLVNGNISRVGYEFQYFTSPEYRRKGIARLLHQRIEDDLTNQRATLSFVVILEGNLPSVRLFENLGFRRHRQLLMPTLLVYQEVEVPDRGKIRPITSGDLTAIAELLNETWHGYDLYEPASAEALARFLQRTPACSFNNLFVLEDQSKILACLGFWDWGQITQITVKALSFRLQMVGLMAQIARWVRPMPRVPEPGTTFKQWCLTPIAFKDSRDLATLLSYIYNQARQRGIEQISCFCERNHPLLRSMKGFFRTNVTFHVYIKPLQKIVIGNNPVFFDAVDL